MSKATVTACLNLLESREVTAAIADALAPFDLAEDPESGRWDSWTMSDSLFLVAAGNENDRRLVRIDTDDPSRCEGGPKVLLDLDTGRAAAADAAAREWDAWAELAAAHPPALPLSDFLIPFWADPGPQTIARARHAHADQPVMRAFRARLNLPDGTIWQEENDPIMRYATPREDFVRIRAARVIPTGALLTAEGEWVDDESFGDLDDWRRVDRYYTFADDYLRGLGDDVWLIRVLIHY
ncbi:hypothetical protein AB0B66_28350 [Catellatospora sp. NPDC049111]|uniref:hypothetical protein n=1 Tax=Catellatospora sp. NPDC049111 TaxID=3155271 RepID=UPI0033D60CEC